MTTGAKDNLRVETLGCRLNSWESEVMRDHARAAGLENAVIVNSCAVTGEAVRQTRQRIRKAHRANPDAQVIVTGCAAQVEPGTFDAMPEVSRVIGNEEKLTRGAWDRLAKGEGGRVQVSDIMRATRPRGAVVEGMDKRARAHVQVQTGCDHRCTFCIIPYGRGNSRSVPTDEVVTRVRRLVETGHQEIVLTGVDITSWGEDLDGKPELGVLAGAILREIPELPRLRLSSIDAVEIDDVLFELIGSEPRLMPHLHLSLQHGDDMMLKRMKRRHLRHHAIALTDKIRAARPDVAFGADLIAGFPTETEAMFGNAVSLVEECGLSYLHVFPFSPREGTPAARMPQLDRALVKERAARLREAGDAALNRHLDRRAGTAARALVEKPGFARDEDFTPVRMIGGQPGDIAELTLGGANPKKEMQAAA